MFRLLKIIAVCSFLFSTCAYCAEWTYEDQDEWPIEYPTCGMNRQSPINIYRSEVFENYSLALELINYKDKSFGYTITNNGHSVQFTYAGGLGTRTPYLTGSVVNYEIYRLAQFHPHWGTNKFEGSEHTIDGFSYPFETHFVHYNVKYPDFETALGQPDGVVVLGVFHQYLENYKLTEMLSIVRRVVNTTETMNVYFPIRLRDLLPLNIKKFYTYSGSLTTPPCTENVKWIVLDHYSYIGLKQANTFRSILSNNFRETQPIGTRLVQASFDTTFSLTAMTDFEQNKIE